MSATTQEAFEEFLSGFAIEAGIDESEAHDQWAGFSTQLDDDEREEIEAGGFDAGLAEGKKFAELYPSEDDDS